MTMTKHRSVVLAGCLLAALVATGASAQSWGRDGEYERSDRDRGGDRSFRDRDRRDDDGDRGREWRGRDLNRGRDWRDWSRNDRGWRRGDGGSHCYYVRRRIVDPDGDIIIRRSRICED